ncbi:Homocysteine S-methyltransferase [Crucibulum laeve]|uniref:Homocysteine S-methyltransferase n=1 Tax=Crucibulum laeve TaxID=68775 RepID=A0A5C3MGY9_9AGAR|nr:Homocysteine S-methyltransferase [Crucibulum laeve]
MANFSELFHSSPIIMDGGLGTALEDVFGLHISDTPLWSAKAIAEDPETITAAHLAYIRAGARVILTSTYQCSISTFQQAGYDEKNARSLMLKAVQLTKKAREDFYSETRENRTNENKPSYGEHVDKRVHIALSLGPFGATLSPTQEFDGLYPPPYGPRGYSAAEDNYNAFIRDDDENLSIEVLARFHFERLIIFANDPATWEIIDCIAFETVPLRREVKAIRKAMGWLKQTLGETKAANKPWWVSCVFPGGESPEECSVGGARLTAEDMIEAAMGQNWLYEQMAVPNAIGINCTNEACLPNLIGQFEKYLDRLAFDGSKGNKPWLILYPNGGDEYDSVTRSWIEGKNKSTSWGQRVWHIVTAVEEGAGEGRWGGIAVGGCCKTGPKEIASLREAIAK